MMTALFLTVLLATDLQRGGELYARYCALCHGNIGASNGPVAPLLFPPARPLPPDSNTFIEWLRGNWMYVVGSLLVVLIVVSLIMRRRRASPTAPT